MYVNCNPSLLYVFMINMNTLISFYQIRNVSQNNITSILTAFSCILYKSSIILLLFEVMPCTFYCIIFSVPLFKVLSFTFKLLGNI